MISEVLLEKLTEFIKNRVNYKIVTSYLSGSMVEGYNTQKSDYDVYVLIEDNSDVDIDSDEFFYHFEDNICEVTYVKLSKLKSIFSKINDGQKIDWYQSHLIHRLITGVPLINPQAHKDLIKQADVKKFLFFLKSKELKFGEKCFSDAMGNLLSEDHETAVFNAERTLNAAADALLAHKGCTSTSIKWRLKNLVKFYGSEHVFVKSFRDIYGSIDLSSVNGMINYIHLVGRYWQTTLDYVQDTEINLNESELNRERFSLSSNKGSLLKNPLFRVWVEQDKFILTGYNAICEINNDVYNVWIKIDNKKGESKLTKEMSADVEIDVIDDIIRGLIKYKAIDIVE